MKHLLILLGLTIICSQSAAQLEIINQGDGFLIYTEEEAIASYSLEVLNTSDSLIKFDWEISIPEEIQDHISFDLHDFNLGWAPHITSSCGFNQPNELDSMEKGYMTMNFRTVTEIPADLDYLIDSIEFNFLSYPDCEILYANINGALELPTSNHQAIDDIIEIYPNPTTGILYFRNMPLENIPFRIFSKDGKLLQSGILKNNQLELSIENSDLLIFNLQYKGKNYYEKILISND